MRIGSLFAGIGGLELGLEASGLGHTVWQVERDAYCRSVLARHWPHADRSVTDVKEASEANLRPVDVICGGFPCQDISGAGSRKGLAGSRSGLWYEFARIVDAMRPSWVVVENVASGASRWVDAVCADLQRLNFQALPIPLSACDVGAPHRRARVFIVAHADRGRCGSIGEPMLGGLIGASGGKPDGRGSPRPDAGQPRPTLAEWTPEPPVCGVAHGPSTGVDRARLRALGNAVVPQCAEVIGHAILELERRRKKV